MKPLSFIALLLLALLSRFSYGDFALGARYYDQGQFEKAYKEFLLAASYGDKDAQYNLGAMYFRGEHVEKNLVTSYGWFALYEEGRQGEVNAISEKIFARLNQEQKTQALAVREQFFERYSQEGISRSLSPELSVSDAHSEAFSPLRKVAPEYPASALRRGETGWVDVSFTIAEDGSTREHVILYSSYAGLGDAALKAVRQWRYNPRRVDGKAVPTTGIRNRLVFQIAGTSFREDKLNEFFSEQRSLAETGDAEKQFQYAYALGAAESLAQGMESRKRQPEKIEALIDNANEWFEKSASQGNASAAYFLGLNTLQGRYCEKSTFKSAGWLYRAAMLGSADAKYTLAIEYLAGAFFERDATKGLHWLQQAAASLPAAQLRYVLYLATAQAPADRDLEAAQSYLERVDKDYHDKLTVLEVKAAIAAARGDFTQAVKWQERALDEANDLELDLTYYTARLDQYRAQRPLRL